MPTPAPRVLALLAAAALVAGCGSAKSTSTSGKSTGSTRASFPGPGGRNILQLRQAVGAGPPILAPAGLVLDAGSSRFAFALFSRDRQLLAFPDVAIYTAGADGRNVQGPFRARDESLVTEARFRSRTVAQDPAAAKAVYVAAPRFAGTGTHAVLAVARLGGRVVASNIIPVRVGGPQPPRVGDRAVLIHTPTAKQVHGDLAKIDTRLPPDDMHAVDFADVVGRKPAVLVFATPQLCQSRTCAPIVDEVLQVESKLGRRAAFIHMEVFNNNRMQDGYRPQFQAWRLPSEPWIFTVDRRGRVAARIEGPASVAEIRRAVERAL